MYTENANKHNINIFLLGNAKINFSVNVLFHFNLWSGLWACWSYNC